MQTNRTCFLRVTPLSFALFFILFASSFLAFSLIATSPVQASTSIAAIHNVQATSLQTSDSLFSIYTDISSNVALAESDTINAMPVTIAAISCGTDGGLECLPMWRWPIPPLWHHDSGAFDWDTGSAFSGMLLSISAFIWSILAAIVSFAIGADGKMGQLLDLANNLFLEIARISRPFAIIVGIIGVFAGVMLFMKGQVGGLLGKAAMFLIPIGILIGMTAATSPAPEGASLAGQDDHATRVSGISARYGVASPAWIAARGEEIVNSIALAPTESFMDRVEPSRMGATATGGGNCQNYVDNLYSAYDNTGNSQQLAVAFSRLWEESFLNSWYIVQFGSVEQGSITGCRLLEDHAGIPIATQASITGGGGDARYLQLDSARDDTTLRKLIAWSVCTTPDGGWYMANTSEYDVYGGCSAWASAADSGDANTGWDPINIGAGHAEDYGLAYQAALSANANNPEARARIARERDMVNALSGGAGGVGMMGAILSLVTAVGFLFSVGSLALGAAFAGVLLLVLLMLLPVSLIMFAIPQTRQTGTQILKWTIGAVFAKVVLTFLLAVMLFLVVQAATLLQTGNRFWDIILLAIIPVAVWLLMKKILKRFGLDGLMKMKGSLGATGAVAAGMGGAGFAGTQKHLQDQANSGKSMKRRLGDANRARYYAKDIPGVNKLPGMGSSKASMSTSDASMETNREAIVAGKATGGEKPAKKNVNSSRKNRAKGTKQHATREEYATRNGRGAVDDVMFGNDGTVTPKPVLAGAEGTPGISASDPYHAVNFLPDELKERRVNTDGVVETEDQWDDRINGYLVGSGSRDKDGRELWSARDSLTPEQQTAVDSGDYGSLDSVPTIRLSDRETGIFEDAGRVDPGYRTRKGAAKRAGEKERAKGGASREQQRKANASDAQNTKATAESARKHGSI